MANQQARGETPAGQRAPPPLCTAGTSWGNVLVLWACPELEARIWVAKGGAPGLPEPCRERFRPPGGWPWGSFGSHYTLVNRTDDQLRKCVGRALGLRGTLCSVLV